MLEIGRPDLDWVKLANAQGVAASRATTLDEFATRLRAALADRAPHLIEVVI
jgi:acetolactate synthase-1/2/3 large subunit